MLWYAFHRMHGDREVARDALALEHAKAEEPRAYGMTLLNLLSCSGLPRALPPVAALFSVSEDKAQLTRRITMIARFRKSSRKLTLWAAAVVVALACVALTDATPAVEAKPAQVTARVPPEGRALLDEAESLYKAKEYAQALQKYQQVYEQYPAWNYAENALMMVGICHGWMGQAEQSLNALERAVREYPDVKGFSESTYFYLADAYRQAGEQTKALEWYNKCIELSRQGGGAGWPAEQSRQQIAQLEGAKPAAANTPRPSHIPATSTIGEDGRIVDKVDLPFVNDPAVLGAWRTVDFVDTIDDFKPGKQQWRGEFWLNLLVFEEGGKVQGDVFTWTKGYVLSANSQTASEYTVKEMGRDRFLFMQWKSGDYTIRQMRPKYYVLQNVAAETVAGEPMFGEKAVLPPTSHVDERGRIVDKIDWPFVNDPELIGRWESVDFVKEIADFRPGRPHWEGDLFLKELVFLEAGKTANPWLTWTKGLICHQGGDHTAAAYTIKKIRGETYLFFEWKSGDYIIRYMKPEYYVLKKAA